MIGDKLRDLER